MRAAFAATFSPHPLFPSRHAHSIAYHSDDGRLFVTDPFGGRLWQGPYGVGDVIGCGALLSLGGGYSGFFFTRNGRLLRGSGGSECTCIADALVPLADTRASIKNKVLHAIVGADGPAVVGVNFGEMEFAWGPANEGGRVSCEIDCVEWVDN